jgi:hypothetical protein
MDDGSEAMKGQQLHICIDFSDGDALLRGAPGPPLEWISAGTATNGFIEVVRCWSMRT